MKTQTRLLIILLLGGAWWMSVGFAQTQRDRAAKEFMREKLDLSKRLLEGLATENYELLVANGSRLSAMTKEADWRLFENPDYEREIVLFRGQVNALVNAAKAKNLDAATLAYVRVTISCVDCHKIVRGKLVASVPEPAESLIAGQPHHYHGARGGFQ